MCLKSRCKEIGCLSWKWATIAGTNREVQKQERKSRSDHWSGNQSKIFGTTRNKTLVLCQPRPCSPGSTMTSRTGWVQPSSRGLQTTKAQIHPRWISQSRSPKTSIIIMIPTRLPSRSFSKPPPNQHPLSPFDPSSLLTSTNPTSMDCFHSVHPRLSPRHCQVWTSARIDSCPCSAFSNSAYSAHCRFSIGRRLVFVCS